MEFGWNDEFEAFREEVRSFVRTFATPELRAEAANVEEGVNQNVVQQIRDALDAKGWLKMTWAPDLGGQGKSPWYQFIISEQLQDAGLPATGGSAAMIGPAVARFGTDAQREKYLPGLYSGAITCCLGYSEPNAGTDLASLQTGGVRDGDDWIINGQKMWTSGAHTSTHIWLAVRTDPEAPKHRGISMFIVPLNLPGITINPIYTMGMRTNEVFFDDVRVPADSMVGEEGRGWYVLANALDHERVSLGATGLGLTFGRYLRYLESDRPEVLESEANRLRLAEIHMELQVQRALALTNAAIVASGDTPTMQASMAKVWNSELRHRMTVMAMDLLGPDGALSTGQEGAPLGGELEKEYRFSPVQRFGGGANEVQRNIIAQRGLGLPR
jgi:alkylation response protein AidB-like acyl-CoA dehydrogenase